jgi:hypothetical protein
MFGAVQNRTCVQHPQQYPQQPARYPTATLKKSAIPYPAAIVIDVKRPDTTGSVIPYIESGAGDDRITAAGVLTSAGLQPITAPSSLHLPNYEQWRRSNSRRRLRST